MVAETRALDNNHSAIVFYFVFSSETIGEMRNHLNLKKVQKKILSSGRSTKVLFSFIVVVDPGAIG